MNAAIRSNTPGWPPAGGFDAVVIGASAGGIEALTVLLPALPAKLAATVFVVLHLPRERPSLLVEIFASRCALPLRDADDKEPVRAGTVYFAPSDYHLMVDRVDQPWLAAPSSVGTAGVGVTAGGDGTAGVSVTAGGSGTSRTAKRPVDTAPAWHVSLSADEPVHFSRPSIDVLFHSAAEAYGERLLAIVLTGASQDGAEGLAAVHAAGGITIVQSPDEAQASLMPRAAIDRLQPHHVLPLEGIAARLRALGGDDAGRSTSGGDASAPAQTDPTGPKAMA